MAALVVPAATDGRVDDDLLVWLTGRFALLSMVAPMVMLLTGLYLVGAGYSTTALLASTRGKFVLAMVGLWVVLSVLTNDTSRRLAADVETLGVERAAGRARVPLSAAGVVGLALLLVGGWL